MHVMRYAVLSLALAALFASRGAEAQSWPPALPGAVNGTATIRTDDFLTIPPDVVALRTNANTAPFVMAKTAPVVELAYHGNLPNPALNGTGWSAWGDIGVDSNGTVYSGTGDHGNNATGAFCFIYAWDTARKELRQIIDVNAVSKHQPGDVYWSKVHAGIHEGADGKIYAITTLNDGGLAHAQTWTTNVPGSPIFRYDPATGKTDIAGHLPGQCTATTLMDKPRNTLYIMLEGKHPKAVAFSAYDLGASKFSYISPYDAVTQDRNMALARNGCVYFNGKEGLWKFDPKKKEIRATRMVFAGGAVMRSSTEESADGWIYGTTFGGDKTVQQSLFRFAPASDKLEMLGPDFLDGDYTTVCTLSSDGKYVYYLPGAHGSSLKIGTPVLQYNVKSGQRKVLAFLQDAILAKSGYVPCGTYGVKLSADNATLYVNLNGHAEEKLRLPKMPSNGFGLTAFAAIHIPASER
jgi:hypothetical protein